MGGIGISAVFTLVAAPLYLAQYVGTLVTYAEQRAWEAPLTSAAWRGSYIPPGGSARPGWRPALVEERYPAGR